VEAAVEAAAGASADAAMAAGETIASAADGAVTTPAEGDAVAASTTNGEAATPTEGGGAAAEPPIELTEEKKKILEARTIRREEKRAQFKRSFELMRTAEMDTLIIAVKFQPLPILKALLPLLSVRSSFVFAGEKGGGG
jgi:hypothetical protein